MKYAVQNQQVQDINYTQPRQAYILPTRSIPLAVLWQNCPLLWLHLPVLPVKVLNLYFEEVVCLVQKSQTESKQYFGRESNMINCSLY